MEEEKYLYAIIRKPQSGKTFICLENIKLNLKDIHIVITMNTIKSSNQFLSRSREVFGEKICIFNSEKLKKEEMTMHVKNPYEAIKSIKKGNSILIVCAHPKRFRKDINEILECIDSDKYITTNVFIHIDEAHAYVPIYRKKIIKMNENPVVNRIYMYSATPFNIFTDNEDIFKNIYIVDTEKEFKIIKSKDYFGVKNCDHKFLDNDFKIPEEKDTLVSEKLLENYGIKQKNKTIHWYEKGPFDTGNELRLIYYTKYILEKVKDKEIKQDEFSYNFIPGYTRKITHYGITDIILEIYPNSLVIVINGEGTTLFCKEKNKLIEEKISNENIKKEACEQVEFFINKYPNKPTFITGFICVGMSITFINEKILNFDNVFFSHEHYNERPEIQYQLCRFLFNYMKWKKDSRDKIKKTNFFTSNSIFFKNCIEYEKQINKIEDDMGGSIRTKEEIQGNIKPKETIKPKEKEYDFLIKYCEVLPIKTFSVSDGNDKEILEEVKSFYKKFTGKELSGKSLPEKNSEGFYTCTTTGKNTVQVDVGRLKQTIRKWSPISNFAITKTQLKYCRVYVCYDDLSDPSDYSWLIRRLVINKGEYNEEIINFWDKIKSE